ncbi:hypothetical protein CLIB1444_03S03994 [[Candida] jaroonii]|uniref:Uncharacterized protein n=1 Tax=[Candida] jaroonii TaxID=467808 RepID=A0ACA9Y517_9ASCO|nr:hypothetical protein CLIB1444_03S03994 [[Candida] jaroonii]
MSGVITFKVTSLLIKTLSKPIANAIKRQTRQSEFFKSNFVKFGQFINRIDLRLRNNNSNIKVRPLNDNKAIETGSNFLSEVFVFSIGAGLIIYESTKPKKSPPKEESKEIPPSNINQNDLIKVIDELNELKHQNQVILKEIDNLKYKMYIKDHPQHPPTISSKSININEAKQSV